MSRQRRATAWYAAAVAMLLVQTACRLREGEHCFCADECRGGLACVTDRGALEPGTCVTEGAQAGADPLSGICADQGEQMGGQAPTVRPLVPFDDSKRDLPREDDGTTLVETSMGESDTVGTSDGSETASSSASTGSDMGSSGRGDESSSSGGNAGSSSGSGESSGAEQSSTGASGSSSDGVEESSTGEPGTSAASSGVG